MNMAEEVRRLRVQLSTAENDLERARELIQSLLIAERCPNCPDQGWYSWGLTEEPEQVQCEWCGTTETSLFKAKERAKEFLEAHP